VFQFRSDVAFSLKFAKLRDGAAETVFGLGAGAVDELLALFIFVGEVEFVIGAEGDGGFDNAATAETPAGANDFIGQGEFEFVVGIESFEEALAGFFELIVLAVTDEIAGGEEAFFERVLGRVGLRVGCGVGCFED